MKKTRVFVADDHPVIRSGLHAVFEGSDLSIVGEADDGPSTIEKVIETKPDVLITDITMPGGLDIVEIIRRVKEKAPQVAIIVFTMHHDQRHAVNSLRAGAKGYVLKGADTRELIDAVRAVAAGKRYISPEISEALLENIGKGRDADPIDLLSDREKEVLKLFAEGNRTKEIADRLGLSTATIKKHRSNIMSKLKIKSTADLVKIAIKKGLYTIQ